MFSHIDFIYIFGPVLILVVISGEIYKSKVKPYDNEFEKSIFNLKITLIQMGVLLIVLFLAIPSTPSLSTFGYPRDINSVNTNEEILSYLQDYNKAIVRTSDILRWTVFLIALLSSFIYKVVKAYTNKTKNLSNWEKKNIAYPAVVVGPDQRFINLK